ncbi:hypothetical protein Mcup_1094 [Metallosphaera cuprina Ar-4]|uniref:Uncharacterized protein n=1 Tax=Metallosphaera cuprina (strain Ar-4) TaxID=1006006 RepID=F4G301_METCR|nr:hypothetical protein Mcup_1094 [Metallosphaera cuprina Ar-4]
MIASRILHGVESSCQVSVGRNRRVESFMELKEHGKNVVFEVSDTE